MFVFLFKCCSVCVCPNLILYIRCVGGVFINDGSNGESIYGMMFDDENFTLRHSGRGVLSMYSLEPDTARRISCG